MKKVDQNQIDAEVKALKELAPNVRKFSLFGDNNQEAIQAQVRVLEAAMTESDAESYFDWDADNVIDAALEAIRWREGHSDPADGPPSKGWENLRLS